jgi:hypothetical protein
VLVQWLGGFLHCVYSVVSSVLLLVTYCFTCFALPLAALHAAFSSTANPLHIEWVLRQGRTAMVAWLADLSLSVPACRAICIIVTIHVTSGEANRLDKLCHSASVVSCSGTGLRTKCHIPGMGLLNCCTHQYRWMLQRRMSVMLIARPRGKEPTRTPTIPTPA